MTPVPIALLFRSIHNYYHWLLLYLYYIYTIYNQCYYTRWCFKYDTLLINVNRRVFSFKAFTIGNYLTRHHETYKPNNWKTFPNAPPYFPYETIASLTTWLLLVKKKFTIPLSSIRNANVRYPFERLMLRKTTIVANDFLHIRIAEKWI